MRVALENEINAEEVVNNNVDKYTQEMEQNKNK
jgi:hypothetical protein